MLMRRGPFACGTMNRVGEKFRKTSCFCSSAASSGTGIDRSRYRSPTCYIARSRGTVMALRHRLVGTTCAYCQLLIQPMKILREPVFDQVTPA